MITYISRTDLTHIIRIHNQTISSYSVFQSSVKLITVAVFVYLGKIPQNKCPLYIAGRGEGYDRSEDFYGYLDNVSICSQ